MPRVREFERDPFSHRNLRCLDARDKNRKVKSKQWYIRVLTEFACFENVNVDAADKTKICPSIL